MSKKGSVSCALPPLGDLDGWVVAPPDAGETWLSDVAAGPGAAITVAPDA